MITARNRFVPERFDEFVSHLTLGIEPIDAVRGGRMTSAMDVTFDTPPGTPENGDWKRLQRHPSLVYVVLYDKRLRAPFQLRLQEPARRFVPRRISYEIALPPSEDLSGLVRIGRPRLFPGAGYAVTGGATGVRGRAVWRTTGPDGRDIPIPWVRVEAKVKNRSVGWAHGDDRGEFLLLLRPDAARATPEFDKSLEIAGTVTVFAPSSPPPLILAPFTGGPNADPLQDLPVETVSAGDEDVPVDQLPWTGGKLVSRDLSFHLGQLLSLSDPFVFNP